MTKIGLPKVDRIGGRRVLAVMALEAEYGLALRSRIRPLMTGVGPVESAVAVTAALTRLADAGQLPDAVLSIGSAGSRVLTQGGVYQAASVSYRDMDASALGFAPGETPFSGLPTSLPLWVPIPGIPQARLSTGANVVSGAAYDAIDAEMVDMESWAICRASMAVGVPLIGLRGISDGVAPLTGLMDWTQYLDRIDAALADAVDRLDEALSGGAALPFAPARGHAGSDG